MKTILTEKYIFNLVTTFINLSAQYTYTIQSDQMLWFNFHNTVLRKKVNIHLK